MDACINDEFHGKVSVNAAVANGGGKSGAFEVTVANKLIHSKLTMGHGKCQVRPRARGAWALERRGEPAPLALVRVSVACVTRDHRRVRVCVCACVRVCVCVRASTQTEEELDAIIAAIKRVA